MGLGGRGRCGQSHQRPTLAHLPSFVSARIAPRWCCMRPRAGPRSGERARGRGGSGSGEGKRAPPPRPRCSPRIPLRPLHGLFRPPGAGAGAGAAVGSAPAAPSVRRNTGGCGGGADHALGRLFPSYPRPAAAAPSLSEPKRPSSPSVRPIGAHSLGASPAEPAEPEPEVEGLSTPHEATVTFSWDAGGEEGARRGGMEEGQHEK